MKGTQWEMNSVFMQGQRADQMKTSQKQIFIQFTHNKLKLEMYFKSSQVKLSFIVIPLHVWTYSGTKCRASQDHGATWIQTYNSEVKQYKPIHN